MERIAVAGLSLPEAGLAGLERSKRRLVEDEARFAREVAGELGASEIVVLSTCNRLEVFFAREEGHLPRPEDLDTVASALGLADAPPHPVRLHFAVGLDCARHLFRVASSLDSLVVGEGEILAQVRDAFERAHERGWTGRLLGPLFQQALQIGKEVRTRTTLARRPVSVVSLALATLARRFEGETPRVAVIGAGKMGRLAAIGAEQAGLGIALIVNRSLAAAEQVAAGVGARAVGLDDFRAAREPVDALISATSAPGVILDATCLDTLAARTPLGRPLLAIDLGVPRDLEPALSSRVEIVDLEALREAAQRNRELRAGAAREAEALIEKKLASFTRRSLDRRAAGALEELRGETRDILEREIRALSTGRLAGLSEEQRRAVERWARAAFGRIEHAPLTLIKRLCEDRDSSLEGGA